MKFTQLLKEDSGVMLWKCSSDDGDDFYKIDFSSGSRELFRDDFEIFIDCKQAHLFYDAFVRGYNYAKAN